MESTMGTPTVTDADSLLDDAPAASGEQHAAVLALLGEFLPLDEQRAVDACVWMAFKNAARTRPFLAAEADRSHRAVAAVVGGLILGLAEAEGVDADHAAGLDLLVISGTVPINNNNDDGSDGSAGVDQQVLVTEAELLLAVLDGLTMHALLQPEWMTAVMCRDVLEAHLEGLNRRLAAGQPAVNAS